MGRRRGDQRRPFYEFHLVDRVPKNYLLRRINVFVTAALADCTRSLSRITATTAVPRLIPDGNPNANRGGTATVSAPSAGYARRSGTSPIGGSVARPR